jgi:aminoglycoside phosphotransferase (APT) family kinase protein
LQAQYPAPIVYPMVNALLEAGYVSPEDIVTGELEVLDFSRRNRNFLVRKGGDAAYFVKCGGVETGLGTVAHEARAYGWLDEHSTTDTRSATRPEMLGWIGTKQILVLEAVDPAVSVGQLSRHGKRLSMSRACAIGRALGRFHSVPVPPGSLPDVPPDWLLSVHMPSLEATTRMSMAALGLTRQLQQHAEFCAALDKLLGGWEPRAAINGDIKWENILFRMNGRSPVFVDWEFLGIGDPAWDMGCVFAEYLFAWTTIQPDKLADAHDHAEALEFELDRHTDAIQALWYSYAKSANLEGRSHDRFLLRAMQFCAGRIVMKCFERQLESAFREAWLDPSLQLAANILDRPMEAAAQLFVLSPSSV